MLLILLSFNYTPPSPTAFTIAYVLAGVLFASIISIKPSWVSALISGIGSFMITWFLYGTAEGDMGGWAQIIQSPINGVLGAILGSIISYIRYLVYDSRLNEQTNRDEAAKILNEMDDENSPDKI